VATYEVALFVHGWRSSTNEVNINVMQEFKIILTLGIMKLRHWLGRFELS
jgi:hypothetical protein